MRGHVVQAARRQQGVVACAVAASALVLAAPARADDWGDCIGRVVEKVEPACTAVIEQGDRSANDLAQAHARRGDWYRRNNRLDEARADFDEALALSPRLYAAVSGRGWILQRQGKVDEAIADFTRAIEIAPGNAQGYLQRADAHTRNRDWTAALADLDQAIALRLGDPEPYYWRGVTLSRIGDFDRAPSPTMTRRLHSSQIMQTHFSHAPTPSAAKAAWTGQSRTTRAPLRWTTRTPTPFSRAAVPSMPRVTSIVPSPITTASLHCFPTTSGRGS